MAVRRRGACRPGPAEFFGGLAFDREQDHLPPLSDGVGQPGQDINGAGYGEMSNAKLARWLSPWLSCDTRSHMRLSASRLVNAGRLTPDAVLCSLAGHSGKEFNEPEQRPRHRGRSAGTDFGRSASGQDCRVPSWPKRLA